MNAADESTVSPAGESPIGPDNTARDLTIRRPDTDAQLPHYGVVGDTYTILMSAEETNDRYGLIDMHVPQGGGPPLHRHDFEEMFHVLEGTIQVTFRGRTQDVRTGETVNIPARAPHYFRNREREDARVLCMVTPPGLEEYFGRWGEPLPERQSIPTLTDDERREALQQATGIGASYRIENLPQE